MPGLSGVAGSLSFESIKYPGSYLVVKDGKVVLASSSDSSIKPSFNEAASFIPRTGSTPDSTLLELGSQPGSFLNFTGNGITVV